MSLIQRNAFVIEVSNAGVCVRVCARVWERSGREGETSVSKMRTHHWVECLMSWLHIGSRRRFP